MIRGLEAEERGAFFMDKFIDGLRFVWAAFAAFATERVGLRVEFGVVKARMLLAKLAGDLSSCAAAHDSMLVHFTADVDSNYQN